MFEKEESTPESVIICVLLVIMRSRRFAVDSFRLVGWVIAALDSACIKCPVG